MIVTDSPISGQIRRRVRAQTSPTVTIRPMTSSVIATVSMPVRIAPSSVPTTSASDLQALPAAEQRAEVRRAASSRTCW